MLCFITTDAAIDRDTLQAGLQQAVAESFNRITVEGDMSTNDTVLVLANGMAGNRPLGGRASGLKSFQAALNHVCLPLARMIVRDGEGVSRFVTLRLSGARSQADADAAVRAVANSSLVKTSWNESWVHSATPPPRWSKRGSMSAIARRPVEGSCSR
jgi:glutamate N-acetyltransferase/amino-acid N-acetyltransferase